jgi:tetratricopeptide (TPR) repeat protein
MHHLKIKTLPWIGVALCAASFVGRSDAQATRGTELEKIDVAACGNLQEVRTGGDSLRTDYRLRDGSDAARRAVADLDSHHTNPASQAMSAGEYFKVKADLNFTLQHSPNHHRALQLLVDFDRRTGGDLGGAAPTECYFYWAQLFAPDDPVVWLAGGYYYQTKHDNEMAKRWYSRALKLDPDYPDAHYNLGLLYVELKDYPSALEHAHAAYAVGYPLPGLRNKLKGTGQWRDAEPAEGNGAVPDPR